eukprot:TRINITY_DN65720_c0_g1_i1.p1 TRINITY_DN65720_c0_g1~~TRINITY_DN65720_c0_g1_i1.p1  ORF type:complete len:163 (-),score=28.45 TRINITY_DN65720_c0_g1_i1:60-485(-)
MAAEDDHNMFVKLMYKMVIVIVVSLFSFGVRAIVKMEGGPPVTAMFLTVVTLGGGINLGIAILTKNLVRPKVLGCISFVGIVVACLVISQVLAPPQTSMAYLRERNALIHAVFIFFGLSSGITIVGLMGSPEDFVPKKKKR